jgi:hypothetical protein
MKQAACRKSAMPYYYPTHVATSSQLSDESQTLTHFRDHFRPILTYNWTPLEEQVTNTIQSQHICSKLWLTSKLWPISKTTPSPLPSGQSQIKRPLLEDKSCFCQPSCRSKIGIQLKITTTYIEYC